MSQFGGIPLEDNTSKFGGLSLDEEQSSGLVDTAKELGRQAGLTARYGIEGVSALPAAVADIPSTIATAISGKPSQTPSMEQEVSDYLTQLGLPEPKNAEERVVGDISRGVAGTGGMINAANTIAKTATSPVAQEVAKSLAAAPVRQAVAAATGATAAGTAREAGAPEWGQAVAGLAGSLTPNVIEKSPNYLLGVGKKAGQNIISNVNTFAGAGTTPTVGQATEGRVSRAIESLLSKIPGGAGVMANKASTQAQDIGKRIDELATSLAPNADAEMAGRSIEKGIRKSFIPLGRSVQKTLYDNLDQYIPQDATINTSNTTDTLNRLTAPIKGAENLSKSSLLSNNVLENAKESINKDINKPINAGTILDADGNPIILPNPDKGQLPYRAIKELRTRIGEKLENVDLAPDVPKAQLKQLYGALSQDMEQAAKDAGPDASKAYTRANAFTRAFHNRIDQVEGVIDKNGGPEKIFQAAISGTGEGATTLGAVMKSIPTDDKKMVSSAVLRRLGRATPGNQNDVGDVFSMNTFLTNWNKMSPKAKSVLFSNYGSDFNTDLNKIARVASNFKEGSKVFANPSGTAGAEELIKKAGTAGAAVMGGQLAGVLPAVLGSMGAAHVGGRLMTNPTFVNWLAKNSMKSARYLPAAAVQLDVLARRYNDPDMKRIAETLK